MSLKTKLGKADYEALEDSLKTFYIADGDGFKLDADYEDVTGLKNKNAELLSDAKKLKEQLKQFEGVDVEAAKAALEAAQQAADEKLKAEGNFDAIKQQYEERIKSLEDKYGKEVEKERGDKQAILANLKRERLANVLTEKGVLPDRVKYLAHDLDSAIELVSEENGFALRKIGGIGDETEFNNLIEDVRQRSPFFFASDTVPGSGASGSDSVTNNNGLKRSAMTTREKSEYVSKHGQEAYEALPFK